MAADPELGHLLAQGSGSQPQAAHPGHAGGRPRDRGNVVDEFQLDRRQFDPAQAEPFEEFPLTSSMSRVSRR
ncbi:MAG TPA: hypothetical protein VIR27_01265 [Mycobacteriales bacterium]